MQCMYATEKSNIMVFGKKNKPSEKKASLINQAVDLDFLVINSTFQSDALVCFISDKILKQISLLMLPQAKYHVLNLPETNRQPRPGHSLGPTELLKPAEKCRWRKDCWI